MVILRATSNLGGQKENKWMLCSITRRLYTHIITRIITELSSVRAMLDILILCGRNV